MNIPRRLWRFHTKEARDKLAARFGLPNEAGMQDWHWQVADPERVDEFLAAYRSGELSEDERFTLMDTIIHSSQGWTDTETELRQWNDILALLEENIELHIYTLCYWACLETSEDELEELAFEAAPDMRAILNRHSERFGYPFTDGEDEPEE